MWRGILKFAIKALIASGLAEKAKKKIGGWLKRKFDSSAKKAKTKLDDAEVAIAKLLKEQAEEEKWK